MKTVSISLSLSLCIVIIVPCQNSFLVLIFKCVFARYVRAAGSGNMHCFCWQACLAGVFELILVTTRLQVSAFHLLFTASETPEKT